MGEDSKVSLTIRNTIIVTVIAICFNPISLYLGYYLSKRLQSPVLEIQYSDIKPPSESYSIPQSLMDELTAIFLKSHGERNSPMYILDSDRNENNLGTESQISRLIKELKECDAEQNETIRTYTIAIEKLIKWSPAGGEVLAIPVMKESYDAPTERIVSPAEKISMLAIASERIDRAKDMLERSKRAQKELSEVHLRSRALFIGPAKIVVGILNRGDTDGVVFPNLSLSTNNIALKLTSFRRKDPWEGEPLYDYRNARGSINYSVIPPHSFAEITFQIIEKDNVSLDLTKFSEMIRNKIQDTVHLKFESGHGAITAETKMPLAE